MTLNMQAMCDMIDGARAQRPHLCPRRIDLLQDRIAAHLWASRAARSRTASTSARALTSTNTRRTMPGTSCCGRAPSPESRRGNAPGCRAGPGWHIECSAMALRLLDGRADRHPRRRRRSDLPASRERDRAGRGCHEADVLALLGARRASLRREREDVEVARQRLHRSRHRRQRLSAVGAAVSAAVVALPEAAELHLDRDGAGRGVAAASRGLPRPAG